MSVSLAIILDTRRVKENQKYPVKLRINYKRVTLNYQMVFDLSKEDYEKLTAPRITAKLQAIKTKLRQVEREAEDCIKNLEEFSFQSFEASYINSNPLFKRRQQKSWLTPSPQEKIDFSEPDFDYTRFKKKFSILSATTVPMGTLTWSYQEYIKRLVREERIGTAVNYHCSYVSLIKFKGDVSLQAITLAYLKSYEKKAKGEGLSKSTIGMYVRALRAIVNVAIENGLLVKDKSYPFGKKKYKIPTARKVKKALDLTDVENLFYHPLETASDSERRSRDYWLFSYFGNGMNPKDIACLKYSNIHDEYIVFERAKTERSLCEDPVLITVYLNEDMKAIIKRWGNEYLSPDTYIFPILESGVEPLTQYTRIQNFVKLINKYMKRIALRIGIEKKSTTYVARHTFSTVLKRSGASTEFIKEALGHAKLETTESYLDSFDNATKKEVAGKLSSFKREAANPEFIS